MDFVNWQWISTSKRAQFTDRIVLWHGCAISLEARSTEIPKSEYE